MAKTYNPSSILPELDVRRKQWVQSVHEQINGNLSLGDPIQNHPMDGSINAGVYNQFQKGNGSGQLVRVDAHGAVGTGAPYTWPAAGGLAIKHQLGRQPIGFSLMDADKDVRVFRTAAPTSAVLTVQPTDITASVTLYIF